jgi:hypothetical protein
VKHIAKRFVGKYERKMTIDKINIVMQLLNCGVIIFTAFAALAWLKSSISKVAAPPDENGSPIDFRFTLDDDPALNQPAEIIVDGNDVLRTIATQSYWNRVAAALACCAAICQALYSLPLARWFS